MGLSQTDEITSGDLFAVFSANAANWRGAPSAVVLDWLNANLTFPNDFVSQYSGPSATGFTVAITPATNKDVHLILTPLAGYAAGTITLPPVAGLRDGQRVLVNITQTLTALTIGLNGATAAIGAPTTLAANAFFTLKYDAVTTNWYRVG